MFRNILYFIIGIFFILTRGPSLACAAGGNVTAVDAALTAYENSQAQISSFSRPVMMPAGRAQAGGVPQWKSSLGEIQETSAAMLETNARLTAEENQLKTDFDDLTARTEALAMKNAQQAGELARMEKLGGTDEMLRLKEVLEDRDRALREQQAALGPMRIRQKSYQNKLALARLRVAELEIDRKSAEIDGKVREDGALAALRADKARIRAGVSKVREQAGLLREKIVELKRVDGRDLPQLHELKVRNAGLRDRLRTLQADDDAARAKLNTLDDKKTKACSEPNIARVRELAARREALAGQLQDNSIKLMALKKDNAADGQDDLSATKADIEKLDRQNVAMDQEIGDLRENIALLEYKINTLQRYTDRNKPGH